MRVNAQYEGIVSDYSRNAANNTGYVRPGSYRTKKDVIFKETQDFIYICNTKRKRINEAIKRGARVLPCLR